MIVARYDKPTGQITGVIRSSVEEQPSDSGDVGYVPIQNDDPCILLQEAYQVVNGAVEAKSVVTLTADSPTFDADGVDTCVISHDATEAITVLLSTGETTVLDPGETLTLASDFPWRFTVYVTTTSVYAAPLTVEAV